MTVVVGFPQATYVPEADPQRTLAEAGAAEPADALAIDRVPSDAATVGSETASAALIQGLGPNDAAVGEGLAPADGPAAAMAPELTVGSARGIQPYHPARNSAASDQPSWKQAEPALSRRTQRVVANCLPK